MIAEPSGPAFLRPLLTLLAFAYLANIFLGATGTGVPGKLLHSVPLYFTQVARLFPRAGQMAIDYRLEVWDCDAGRFVEIDFRRYFPIHPDDKENRFQRVGHFHRRQRPVMYALERYVLAHEAARRRAGGIRVSSLRIPLPEPGDPVPRWRRRPIEAYADAEQRAWYYTSVRRRLDHCAGRDPGDDTTEPTRSPGIPNSEEDE